jgi:hypothetical protein
MNNIDIFTIMTLGFGIIFVIALSYFIKNLEDLQNICFKHEEDYKKENKIFSNIIKDCKKHEISYSYLIKAIHTLDDCLRLVKENGKKFDPKVTNEIDNVFVNLEKFRKEKEEKLAELEKNNNEISKEI